MYLYPQQIPSSPVFPTVKITGFYLRNQLVEAGKKVNNHILLDRSIDHTDSLIFRPGENDLRFDFSAMYYSNPEKIIYKYKLEGYDQEWIVTDARERYANYTNLPSGKYQFKVKASNSADLWNDNPTTLYIHIKTPYALRWWAFVIYLWHFCSWHYLFHKIFGNQDRNQEKVDTWKMNTIRDYMNWICCVPVSL